MNSWDVKNELVCVDVFPKLWPWMVAMGGHSELDAGPVLRSCGCGLTEPDLSPHCLSDESSYCWTLERENRLRAVRFSLTKSLRKPGWEYDWSCEQPGVSKDPRHCAESSNWQLDGWVSKKCFEDVPRSWNFLLSAHQIFFSLRIRTRISQFRFHPWLHVWKSVSQFIHSWLIESLFDLF